MEKIVEQLGDISDGLIEMPGGTALIAMRRGIEFAKGDIEVALAHGEVIDYMIQKRKDGKHE